MTSAQQGFSLVELVVVTAVVVIVSTLVLVNNARFGGVIKLENFAYDVALSIRQAQLYGISVARSQGSSYSAGYGITITMPTPPTPATTYSMFADTGATPNGVFDSGELVVQTSSMAGGYAINTICVTVSGSETCSSASGAKLDIYFIRPEPNAWISWGGSACVASSGLNCKDSARIELKAPHGETKSVVVESSGQISVMRVSQ